MTPNIAVKAAPSGRWTLRDKAPCSAPCVPAEVADRCWIGLPYDMLLGWVHGKMPRSNNGRFVLRLEAYFGVERNSLLTLAGIKARAPKVELGGPPARIEYNEKVCNLSKVPFCIRPAPCSQLRTQWQEFLQYKTAAVPAFKRTKRGRWRFSPCPLTADTDTNWWAFLEGKEVASARVAWARTSAYLGWLRLPSDQGGIGLPEVGVHTLAWLAVPDYLEDFLNWTRDRIGKRNQGVNQFLAFIASLVRPRFGYLRQRPGLQVTLPQRYQVEAWEALCDRQFELTEQLVSAYRHEIEVSRDSFEPIKEIIQLPQPMDAIADMIQRMRADRPVGHQPSSLQPIEPALHRFGLSFPQGYLDAHVGSRGFDVEIHHSTAPPSRAAWARQALFQEE